MNRLDLFTIYTIYHSIKFVLALLCAGFLLSYSQLVLACDLMPGSLNLPVAVEHQLHGAGYSAGTPSASSTPSIVATSAYSPTLRTTIPLGAAPHGVAVAPDGKTIWVTNFVSLGDPRERFVSLIDAATLTITQQIQVGRGAVGVVISSDGSRAYVSNELDDTVSVIDTVTRNVIKTITLPDRPHGMALGQDPASGTVDRRLYVASLGADSISVIDTSTLSVIKTVAVGNTPDSPAVTPDGLSIWVTNYGEGEESTLSLVDALTLSQTFTLTVGIYPHGIKFDPNSQGRTLYVSVEGSDEVLQLDTQQKTITTRYGVGDKPHGLGLSPDGAVLWTGDLLSRTSTLVDTRSGTILASMSTGITSNPHVISFSPTGERVYISDFTGRRLLVYEIERSVWLPIVLNE